ncbi:hypothetical protein D3C87_1734700 [compost metagenome]
MCESRNDGFWVISRNVTPVWRTVSKAATWSGTFDPFGRTRNTRWASSRTISEFSGNVK